MSQSLARAHMHLIFSTKNREPFLVQNIRVPLHAYMATVLNNLKCHAVIVNSVEDHVHILFHLARTVAMSEAVEDVKKSSSKWIKTQDTALTQFAWQSGYGIFAVCESNLAKAQAYIGRQAEHHQTLSFQDEYRAILKKHNVAFDERYIWD